MLRKKQVVSIVSIVLVSFLIGTVFNVAVAKKDGGNPIDAIWEAIYGLQSRTDSLNSSLTDLKASLEAKITDLENLVDSLNASLIEQKERTDSLNASLTSRIEDLEGQIAILQSDLGTLQTQINSLNASQIALETKTTELNASLVELQERMNSAEEQMNQVKTIRFYEPSETYLPEAHGESAEFARFEWIPQNPVNNAIIQMLIYVEWKGTCNKFLIKTEVSAAGSVLLPFDESEVHCWSQLSEEYSSSTIMQVELHTRTGGRWIIPDQHNYTMVLKVQGDWEGYGSVYIRNTNLLLTVIDDLPVS